MLKGFREKELLAIIDNMPGGLCVFNLDNYPYAKVILWNKFMEKVTGCSKEEINRKGLFNICSIKNEQDSIIRTFKETNKKEILLEIIDKYGKKRLLEFKCSITNTKKNPASITALVDEVTEGTGLNEDLEVNVSEAVMRTVVDNSLDMVVIFNQDFNIKYLSPSIESAFGYPLEKFKSMKIDDLIYPEEKNKIMAFAKSLIKSNETAKCQFKALCADGSCKYLETLGKPIYNNGRLDGYILSSRDVTERVKTEEDLIKSKRRYRTLFNNVNDAIYLNKLDEYGRPSRFVEVNNVACKRMGYTRKEMTSMTIYDTTPDLTVERVSDLVDILSEKGNALYEVHPKTKDGRTIPVEINSIFLNLNNEKLVLSISRDITERKEKEKADEYERLRLEFFANISHELRTPVNVIFSALQLANSDSKDFSSAEALYKKYIPIMKQNCFRLIRLINNLIDVTKIDAGYFQLSLLNVNIVSLVENITLSVAQYIETQGITLIFDTDVEEKIIACDTDKIERIMLNLISNAVKFTEFGGSIFVNIMDKGENIIISVKDTGIGISKENQKLIFDRFTQVDKSFARNREGSGIGLSLVKSLVNMHNGTISVKSELNCGSEFIVTLPVCLAPNKEENLNTNNFVIHDNVQKINIEFSDIYSSI